MRGNCILTVKGMRGSMMKLMIMNAKYYNEELWIRFKGGLARILFNSIE